VLNTMKTYHVRSSSSMKLSCWTLLEDAMMCECVEWSKDDRVAGKIGRDLIGSGRPY
jgi:hypothetical protein